MDIQLDKVFDTMMDVEQNPMGAWQALQQSSKETETLRAEVAHLRAALRRIKNSGVVRNYIKCYDCKESSFIARSALANGEADR